jgi:hypothetical protein
MKKIGKKKIELSLKNKNFGTTSEIDSQLYTINIRNNIKLSS